jgi:immunoglobulin-like protein involved in spore germination/sporulation and spore germination protein
MRFRAFAASALALGMLAGGCGGEESSSPPADRSTIPPTVESKTSPAPAILRVYLLEDGKVAVASRAVVAGPAVARAALNALLEGPTPEESARGLTSAIPAGTTLEALELDEDGTMLAELSEPLDEAGTAQVVYTLTQFPTVRRVRLEGEEHVRADFEEETPAILVESPVPGEDVSSPLRIEGTANTFEATFQVEVVDARGRVLGQRFVTATSGSGERGTFDAAVTFAAMPGPVTLVTYEVSAEDGSRINETEMPLQVAP